MNSTISPRLGSRTPSTRRARLAGLAALGTLLVASTLATVASPPADAATSTPDGTSGNFSVATYNVAGLPAFLSSGNPSANTGEIGRRIGKFDVVNVQEDFNYHAALYAADSHPFRTPTSGGAGIGSGLNTLSWLPFEGFSRMTWNACSGTDCLTPKGFTFARVKLGPGAYVDVYNLHTNAGTAAADLKARRSNIRQIGDFIGKRSGGNALVVMGDTNTRYTRDGDNIRELVDYLGLTDAWVQTQTGGTPPAIGSATQVCPKGQETNPCEVVDKIFYRNGAELQLHLAGYWNEDAYFLDAAGVPLSDHRPVSARFDWSSTMPRFSLRSAASGQCVDVDWASQAPAAAVVQFYCVPGRDNQVFRQVGDTLRVAHTGMCLGVARASTAAGAPVEQYPCVGAANQRITWEGDTIRFAHSGMCLDLPNGTSRPSVRLMQWPCHGGVMQRWVRG